MVCAGWLGTGTGAGAIDCGISGSTGADLASTGRGGSGFISRRGRSGGLAISGDSDLGANVAVSALGPPACALKRRPGNENSTSACSAIDAPTHAASARCCASWWNSAALPSEINIASKYYTVAETRWFPLSADAPHLGSYYMRERRLC